MFVLNIISRATEEKEKGDISLFIQNWKCLNM